MEKRSCDNCYYHTKYADTQTRGYCNYSFIMSESRTHKIASLLTDGEVNWLVHDKLKEKPCMLYRKGVRRVKPLP